MKIETFGTREAWLAARRLGIGGSDVPAILGTSPYRTPLQTWADKRGLAEDDAVSYSLRRGHHMEPLLASELAAQANVLVHPNAHAHPLVIGAEPWMRYSPDAFGREADGTRVLCEFKSHPRGASDWREGCPPHVQDQVQWGMYVCDLPRAYVAVDLGTEANWARVERDPAWIEANLPKLREFWTLVETETPPEAVGDDLGVLKRLYPREQSGLTVALDGRFLDLRWEMDQLDAQLKTLTERRDDLKAQIVAEMKDAECAMLPDGSGWRLREEKRPRMVRDPEGGESSSRVLRAFAKKER